MEVRFPSLHPQGTSTDMLHSRSARRGVRESGAGALRLRHRRRWRPGHVAIPALHDRSRLDLGLWKRGRAGRF